MIKQFRVVAIEYAPDTWEEQIFTLESIEEDYRDARVITIRTGDPDYIAMFEGGSVLSLSLSPEQQATGDTAEVSE